MAQIFRRSTNALARITIWGAIFFLALATWIGSALQRSGYNTGQGVTIRQPIPFSHDHHVTGLGIDCRYCHTGVERTAFAGLPPTATCINCHKLIWNDSPLLAPVRESFRTGKPIEWNRVHDLPDFVYFDHSIHVAKGIGCASCHGRIDHMALTYQAGSLQMEWCLDCHRDVKKSLRPRDQVFNMDWQPPEGTAARESEGAALARRYDVRTRFALMNCSTCHR
ncbi:MAG TPA: cytochrome c3 family protein [Thermoanaerobaculia bacterium]|nr:cytochrome c3 family protein [Thermoanaerobaculia bacterium]